MQVPILSGIAADDTPDFRTTYPINLVPVPKPQGISDGYLRTAAGVYSSGEGPGVARGGILWDGLIYRVMGTKLVSISSTGALTELGDVGGSGPVSMVYSFDRLAVASNEKLFYWDKSTLTEVTDPDIGTVLDVEWSDGYFITTDGENIVVTELLDPTSVDPLKYGSSEVDPDPINKIHKIRDEIYSVGRYTIEAFQNVGGSGFPFAVIRGAQVLKGSVGTHASAVFMDAIAFVGSGRNGSIGVHIATGGDSRKISTREIDIVLAGYDDLSGIFVESVEDRGHETVMIHLSDQTLCYDAAASASIGRPVWYSLDAGAGSAYRARYFVWANNCWNVADVSTAKFGKVDQERATVWGESARWQFGLPIIYNNTAKAEINSVELVGLNGAGTVSAQWTENGIDWSPLDARTLASRNDRPRWLRQGVMHLRRMYRFSGVTASPISIASCEADIKGLAW